MAEPEAADTYRYLRRCSRLTNKRAHDSRVLMLRLGCCPFNLRRRRAEGYAAG